MAAQMSHSISIFSLYQVLSRLSILILIVLLQARLCRTPHGVAHDASIMRVGMLRGLSRLRGGVCSARSTPYSHVHVVCFARCCVWQVFFAYSINTIMPEVRPSSLPAPTRAHGQCARTRARVLRRSRFGFPPR